MISKELNMTVDQLKRWRKYSGYEDPRRRNIPPEELGQIVLLGLSHDRSERGKKTLQGRLLAANIKVTRNDLRNSIHRVDPDTVKKRYYVVIPFTIKLYVG
jgi:hypothetical protein